MPVARKTKPPVFLGASCVRKMSAEVFGYELGEHNIRAV
jgi:hypothetical protein